MGVSCDHPLVRSGIKSFDQHTGTLLKTFYTLPRRFEGRGRMVDSRHGRELYLDNNG